MSEEKTPDVGTDDVIEATIDSIVTGGAGLARVDGRVVFVPGTVPGEKVRARIIKAKKGFAEAELLEILESSPDRIEPPLGELGTLSGCDLQHMSIEAQRRIKTDIVRDCFRRQGGIDVEELLAAPTGAGPALGYRNKIRLSRDPVGRWGVIRQGTHDVMPIEEHGLMPAAFNEHVMPWMQVLPPVDQVVIRFDADDNWIASLYGPPARLKTLKAVLKGIDDAPAPGCQGILFNNRPAWGRDHLLIRLLDRTWRVHARSFFQTNFVETEAAVNLARAWLDEAGVTADAPGGALLDLYGGVGLFGLALGDRFKTVIGVEENRQAVIDARNNYKRDETLAKRAKVVMAPVEKATLGWKMSRTQSADGSGRPSAARATGPFSAELAVSAGLGANLKWENTTVVVDPPRTGLGEHVTNDLAALAPTRIIYMSCDPATLARDCGALTKSGYELKRVQVIDMFPMTSHVEAIVELVKS